MVDPIELPKNKFDHERVDHLAALPLSHWKHRIPELITWTQDPNWPIYRAVKDLLLRYPDACMESLIHIFATNDTEWKYWTIQFFISEMPVRCQMELVPALKEERDLREEIDPGREDDWNLKTSEIDDLIDELLAKLGVAERTGQRSSNGLETAEDTSQLCFG